MSTTKQIKVKKVGKTPASNGTRTDGRPSKQGGATTRKDN